MINKFINSLVAALAVLTLVACDKQDDEPKAVGDSPTFSATIEDSGTRASETSWDTGDKIGISLSGSETFENISYTTVNGDGNFTVDVPDKQFIFQDNNPVSFIAYYPYVTLSTNANYRGKIANYATTSISSQTPAKQKTFDYLWAEEAYGSKANPYVKFKFTHRMSKITLVFESDEIDVSDITAYSVDGLYLRGTLDPKDGTCEKYGSTSGKANVNVKDFNITPYNATIENRKPAPPIIIFPQELKSNPVTLSVTATAAGTGTITGSLNFPDGMLKSGDEYRFNIKVSKTRLSIGEATITPWAPEDLGDSWEAW